MKIREGEERVTEGIGKESHHCTIPVEVPGRVEEGRSDWDDFSWSTAHWYFFDKLVAVCLWWVAAFGR